MKYFNNKNQPDYSFVFICQKGDLEIKSILLALTLRKKLSCNFEIIAAIPEMYGTVQEPKNSTIKFLKDLNIRIEYFKNQYCLDKSKEIEGDIYSNKAYCLKLNFKGKKVIFLDSDMLLIKEFKGDDRFFSIDFNAKQARYSHLKNWDSLYKYFDLKQLNIKFPCDADGIYIPPYFNSGFFSINSNMAKKLGNIWIDVFKKITNADIIPSKIIVRRNQISLAIAIQLMNITYEVMDDSYNFPIGDKLLNILDLPFFVHYHHVGKIKNNQQIKNLINSFLKEYEDLTLIFLNHPEWKIFLE